MEWPLRPRTAGDDGRSDALTLARATAARRMSPRRTVFPNLSPNERPPASGCGFALKPHGVAEVHTDLERSGGRSGAEGNGAFPMINQGDRAPAAAGTAVVMQATAWRFAARFARKEHDRG